MSKFCSVLGLLIVLFTVRAYGAEAGMPQLDTEFWAAQIFWLIIVFSILYLIIWKIFLPKIIYSIESRKSRIVNDLNEAQKLKENAEKKLKDYNKIIELAKNEAKKVAEENKKKLDKDIESKKKILNEQIEKEILAVEKEIKNLKKNSISNINLIAQEISSEIIKEIVGSEVNKSNVSALVEVISKKNIGKYL